jgi:hypothetical protein
MALPANPDRAASDRRFRLLVGLGLAVAAAAMTAAVLATQTDEDTPPTASGKRTVVEHLIPLNGAEVLRQSELGVDLASGYSGTLVINDVEIPKVQLREVPELNQVFFTPGEGKVIEELPAGRTCVVAIAWRTASGRGVDDERTTWCFDVT